MGSLIFAFQFLTILPLPKVRIEPNNFGPALVYFPLVGLCLGGLLYGMHQILRRIPEFPPELQAFLMLVILTTLTRAMHLDGFADFVDGFWGGRTKEDTLRIMKDSHVGAFAVVGLILLILGKHLLLTQIIKNGSDASIILVFPMISRWGMVLVCFLAKHAREEGGLAKTFVESLKWPHMTLTTLFAISVCVLLMMESTLWVFACAVAVVAAVRLLSSRKINGITGDVAGATGELIELMVLFVGASLLKRVELL